MAQVPIVLEDATDSAGVDFEHFAGRTGKHFLIETVASGLATFDYDNDGWMDIYLLNGAPLEGATIVPAPKNRLFRNLGNMKFEDVTEQSGSGDLGFALGVAAADYDNDGDQDLFIANYGPNVLLENQGDGTFVRREFREIEKNNRVAAGVALLDADGDGNLDLYFANYVEFTFDKAVNRTFFGVPAAPGPKEYSPDTHTLYHNRGDGTFRDVSRISNIGSVAGPGMGMVAFDYDGDRDTDIFVCNDSAANFLFENKGSLQFEEVALLAGVAYDVTGAQQASMGADIADFDGDGDLDLVTTNFIDEIPTLYRNSGQGYFDDIGPKVGLGVAARSLTWGVGFADFDNDTWPDLFISTGHLIEGSSQVNDTEKFATPNFVLRNLNGRRFENITANVGSAGKAIQVSRGTALDDLDNDGDVDGVVLNLNARPQLIKNETQRANNFLQIQLVGNLANRDAVGTNIRVQAGNKVLVQEVVAGRGYQSHFGSVLHFGLGSHVGTTTVTVLWHSGQRQEFRDIPANGRWLFRQSADASVKLF